MQLVRRSGDLEYLKVLYLIEIMVDWVASKPACDDDVLIARMRGVVVESGLDDRNFCCGCVFHI